MKSLPGSLRRKKRYGPTSYREPMPWRRSYCRSCHGRPHDEPRRHPIRPMQGVIGYARHTPHSLKEIGVGYEGSTLEGQLLRPFRYRTAGSGQAAETGPHPAFSSTAHGHRLPLKTLKRLSPSSARSAPRRSASSIIATVNLLRNGNRLKPVPISLPVRLSRTPAAALLRQEAISPARPNWSKPQPIT